MDFYEVLEHVLVLLQRHRRVSYRSLTRQFDLDDAYLEDLKEAILFTYPVVDEDGRGMVWTGDPAAPEPEAQRPPDAESRFHTVLRVVMGLLQRERRVTYRELKHIFVLDDGLLDDLREELLLKRLAVDEDGKVLVWTGESQPAVQPTTTVLSQPVTAPPAPPLEAEALTPSSELTIPVDAVTAEPTRSALEAERRQLTVMFCDLADSTKLSQQLDPEDLREVVRLYQSTAARVIERYEGHVAQYLGDGLLIYFGWPAAHEDDAQRALYTGLGIVQAITTTLNRRLEQEKGVQLAVRIGVHTGPVVVGEMGGGGRHENLATGETVNIAARLEGLAALNTVLISDVTARLVQGAFSLEDMGAQALKGVAEPMPAFRLLGATPSHHVEDEHMPDGGVFLVGRDEEVGLLLRRWEQAKEGLGQVVLIQGEAGIGKSSLVATIRRRVVEDGGSRITFRCSPYHTNSALYPVITHLEQMLGLEREDTPGSKLDKLEQALGRTNLALAESVPLLATLLSIPLEDRYPVATQSPQQQRQQTLDSLVGWLMEASENQPVLAMWEDLQWADPSTLEILGLLLEQTPTVSLLHVLTFRPEFQPTWATRSHMTPITLNRLERSQVEGMITHLARGKVLPTEVVEHIVAKTDGVPLYIEELTKTLLASDLLGEEADQYVLTGPLFTVAIPDTLQDLLMARLDQMKAAKEVAQLGAVLGREFAYDMLHAVTTQDEETLQEGLAQLVAAELLYHRGRPPKARYIFKHALIQDAAYQSLLRSTRQQIHQRVVYTLEERFTDMVQHQPELVAYHCVEAGLYEHAVDYWHKAGQHANQQSAYREAVVCFEQELDTLQHLPACDATRQKAFDLRIQLRHALFPLLKFDRLLDNLHEAERLLQNLDDPYRLGLVTIYLGHYFWIAGEPTQAARFGQRAVEIASGLEYLDLQVLAKSYQGGILHSAGNYQSAKRLLSKVVTSVEGDLRHEFLGMGILPSVLSRVWLSWTLAEIGELREAIAQGEEGLRIAEAVDHPYSLTHACFGLGFAYLRQGAFDPAIAALERGLTIARLYAPVTSPVTEAHLGYALSLSGRVSDGIQLLEQTVEQAATTRMLFYHSLWTSWLSEAYVLDGNLEGAHGLALQALELSRSREEKGQQAWALRLLGDITRETQVNEAEAGKSYYQQSLTLAEELGMRPLQAHCHRGFGILYRQAGQAEQARTELSTAIEMYCDMEMTFWLPETEAALEQLESKA